MEWFKQICSKFWTKKNLVKVSVTILSVKALNDLEGVYTDLAEAMHLKPEEASDMRDFFEDEPDYKEFM